MEKVYAHRESGVEANIIGCATYELKIDRIVHMPELVNVVETYLEGQHVAVIIASFFCHLVKSNLCNLCCYQLKAFSTESICDIA